MTVIELIDKAIDYINKGDMGNALEYLDMAKSATEAPMRYSAFDAAAKLGLATQTLAGWRSDGKGPKWQKDANRRVFYTGEALRDWQAANIAKQS